MKTLTTQDALQAECFDPELYSRHVPRKAEWVRRLLPAKRLVDAGGMWGCNAYYSFLAASAGAEKVTLLDGMATERFRELAPARPTVEWVQTDFNKGLVGGELSEIAAARPAEALVLYDIMLHQPEPILLLATLVRAFGIRRAVIANPVRRNSKDSVSIDLIPHSGLFRGDAVIHQSQHINDQSGWIWLLSHGFVRNACRYVGLRVVDEHIERRWAAHEDLDYSMILAEAE